MDLEGVVCQIDDILVYGNTKLAHDHRLKEVLQRIRVAGLTLNKEKCEFSKTKVKFFGHIVDSNGVTPDPSKVRAIQDMKQPTSVKEIRRFLGMVNQFSKFSPQLADKTKPLRDLLNLRTNGCGEKHKSKPLVK